MGSARLVWLARQAGMGAAELGFGAVATAGLRFDGRGVGPIVGDPIARRAQANRVALVLGATGAGRFVGALLFHFALGGLGLHRDFALVVRRCRAFVDKFAAVAPRVLFVATAFRLDNLRLVAQLRGFELQRFAPDIGPNGRRPEQPQLAC